MALCPTCHSEIGDGSLETANRQQGSQGSDSNGNPIPFFSDDPVLTPRGLSGSTYAGDTRVRVKHVTELQTLRNEQEFILGITQTAFSPIDGEHISQRHIIELRQSTEKILNILGLTLEEYFKLDANGNEIEQNPRLVFFGANDPQDEWIDIERGAPYFDNNGQIQTSFILPDSSEVLAPSFPTDFKHVRAIHIEDLRHPLRVGGIPALMVRQDFTLFEAQKRGDANFTDVEEC